MEILGGVLKDKEGIRETVLKLEIDNGNTKKEDERD